MGETMPYHLVGNCVEKKDGGKVPGGCHKTRAEALDHLQALEANVGHKAYTFKPKKRPTAPKGAKYTMRGTSNRFQDGKGRWMRTHLAHAKKLSKRPVMTLRRRKKESGELVYDAETKVKEVAATPMVFKEENGDYRWVLLSSNGFRDRDGDIISTKALEQDVALWDLEGAPPDPLRLWHIALNEDFSKGLEVGKTDFRMVHGHTLIESGLFYAKEVGEAVFQAQDELAASIGYHYSPNQPDSDKVFHAVRIFERSLLPKGSASNVLTRLSVVN